MIAYYRKQMEQVKDTPIYEKYAHFADDYLYRYWHIYTRERSREIYKQASAKTMRVVYLMYHTMSPEMAIDRLKESYLEKHKKK